MYVYLCMRVQVLACDKEHVLQAFAERVLSSVPAVKHITKIAHAEPDRADNRRVEMALNDVRVLLLVDDFIGTALSTFSFLVHAMGLLTPYYTGHVLPDDAGRAACVRGGGTEAGFVSRSTGAKHVCSCVCVCVCAC